MAEQVDIDKYLNFCLRRANLRRVGGVKYGWNKKSVGCRVTDLSGATLWLKVHFRDRNYIPDKRWDGESSFPLIPGISKPRWRKSFAWIEANLEFKGELMDYIGLNPCSNTPELKLPLHLTADWLDTLKSSIHRLNDVPTERVGVRQDLINRRIRELLGVSINVEVSKWETAHCDLHWANLTRNQCYILDWEAWGKAPRALDAAFLYCFTLLQPEIAEAIYHKFFDDLNSRDGRISLLFACAELLRMIELHNDHPELKIPLKQLVQRITLP